MIQSFSGSQSLLAGRETISRGCLLRVLCRNPGTRPSWPQHLRRPEKLLIMAWPVRAVHIVIGAQKFMRKARGHVVFWQSAPDVSGAHSKTLRVFQESSGRAQRPGLLRAGRAARRSVWATRRTTPVAIHFCSHFIHIFAHSWLLVTACSLFSAL